MQRAVALQSYIYHVTVLLNFSSLFDLGIPPFQEIHLICGF